MSGGGADSSAVKVGQESCQVRDQLFMAVFQHLQEQPLDILCETSRPFSTMFVATQLGI